MKLKEVENPPRAAGVDEFEEGAVMIGSQMEAESGNQAVERRAARKVK